MPLIMLEHFMFLQKQLEVMVLLHNIIVNFVYTAIIFDRCRGAPLGTVRPRTVTRTKACDPSAAASALPLGRPPPARNTSRLRGGHHSPHAPGPSRRDGARLDVHLCCTV